jgi:hypothetical protein
MQIKIKFPRWLLLYFLKYRILSKSDQQFRRWNMQTDEKMQRHALSIMR